jgi:hypothetical protein
MHKKGENGNNMAQSRNLETMRDHEGIRGRNMSLVLRGGDDKHTWIKYSVTKKQRMCMQ